MRRPAFPPLALSAGQQQQFERLARALVRETLADYEHFWAVDRREVDAARWKPVRRRANIVVYRLRARDGSAVTRGSSRGGGSDAPSWAATTGDDDDDDDDVDPLAQTVGLTSSAFSITERSVQQQQQLKLPKLLAVGSLRGSLDDVMYGLASPDASAMRLRTSYLDDEIVDGAVLLEMQGPSPAEPFRFLGIKWLVKENRGAVKRFVRPRDFVILEYCSVMLRPSGDRVGFHLMHSVEIPTCRELPDRGLLRAKLSSCYLYRELPNGFVDVYMTATVEPRGKVLEAMAIRSAASALTSCWKAVQCAHNKKLAWLLQNDGNASLVPASTDVNMFGGARKDTFEDTSVAGSKKRGCGVCQRAFGAFSKSFTCQLCYEPMCARCRVHKTLNSQTLNTTITKTGMVFCKKCIATVGGESAAEIAKHEIVRSRASSGSYVSRGSFSSLYGEDQYDSRSSERSNYTALFSEPQAPDGDDTQSLLNMSSASHQSTSSPRKQSADWRVSSGAGGALSSRGTAATDALTLVDLDPTDDSESASLELRDDEPVLLNEPVTCGNLRAMDYIVLPTEGDADELESLATSSVYHESEGDDDSRMSQTSSIALMDGDDDDVEAHDGFHPADFRVDEEGESEEGSTAGDDVDSGAVSNGSQLVESTNNESEERISEVHALVRAQSADYDRVNSPHPTHDGEDTLAPLGSTNDFQRPRNQSYQMQLWMQMNDLTHAAENTYQVARRNTDALLAQQGGVDSESSRKLRRFSQPFQFNVVGLRGGRSMTTVTTPQPPPPMQHQQQYR